MAYQEVIVFNNHCLPLYTRPQYAVIKEFDVSIGLVDNYYLTTDNHKEATEVANAVNNYLQLLEHQLAQKEEGN